MLLEPSYPVLIFFALRNGLYLAGLLPIALAKAIVCRSPARLWAIGALILCLMSAVAYYLVPALGLYTAPIAVWASSVKTYGGGVMVPLFASVMMLACATSRGTRWPWLDYLHGAGFIVWLALWAWTTWF